MFCLNQLGVQVHAYTSHVYNYNTTQTIYNVYLRSLHEELVLPELLHQY